MEERTPGRREARKISTKRRLRETALDMFAARGFEAVTAEEIAARAGVSARTFWNYFPTKADVVLLPYTYLVEDTIETLHARAATAPLVDALAEALGHALTSFLESTGSEATLRAGAHLVETEPGLRAHDRANLDTIELHLVDTVTALWPDLPAVTARATLAACLAAARVAVADWASSSRPLAHHLRLAFAELRLLTADRVASAPA